MEEYESCAKCLQYLDKIETQVRGHDAVQPTDAAAEGWKSSELLKHYNRAVELLPEDWNDENYIIISVRHALLQLSTDETNATSCINLIRINCNKAQISIAMAEYYLKKHDREGAIVCLERAQHRQAQPVALIDRAFVALKDEAKSLCHLIDPRFCYEPPDESSVEKRESAVSEFRPTPKQLPKKTRNVSGDHSTGSKFLSFPSEALLTCKPLRVPKKLRAAEDEELPPSSVPPDLAGRKEEPLPGGSPADPKERHRSPLTGAPEMRRAVGRGAGKVAADSGEMKPPPPISQRRFRPNAKTWSAPPSSGPLVESAPSFKPFRIPKKVEDEAEAADISSEARPCGVQLVSCPSPGAVPKPMDWRQPSQVFAHKPWEFPPAPEPKIGPCGGEHFKVPWRELIGGSPESKPNSSDRQLRSCVGQSSSEDAGAVRSSEKPMGFIRSSEDAGAVRSSEKPMGVIRSSEDAGAVRSSEKPMGVIRSSEDAGAVRSSEKPMGFIRSSEDAGAVRSSEKPMGVIRSSEDAGAVRSSEKPMGVIRSSEDAGAVQSSEKPMGVFRSSEDAGTMRSSEKPMGVFRSSEDPGTVRSSEKRIVDRIDALQDSVRDAVNSGGASVGIHDASKADCPALLVPGTSIPCEDNRLALRLGEFGPASLTCPSVPNRPPVPTQQSAGLASSWRHSDPSSDPSVFRTPSLPPPSACRVGLSEAGSRRGRAPLPEPAIGDGKENLRPEAPSAEKQMTRVSPTAVTGEKEIFSKSAPDLDRNAFNFGIVDPGRKNVCVNGVIYNISKVIGRGGSSVVYEATKVPHTEVFAIKLVSFVALEENIIASYKNEVEMLLRLQNTGRIIRLFTHEIQVEGMALVMERAEVDFKSVHAHLLGKVERPKSPRQKASRSPPLLSAEQCLRLWREMLECVEALHESGVVHLDLKPGNFVLVSGVPKLIDLGISHSIPEDRTSVTLQHTLGTIDYMSPEQLPGWSDEDEDGEMVKKRIGRKSDVWALGCILYLLMFGRPPFRGVHILQRLQRIQSAKPVPIPDYPAAPQLVEALRRCLQRDPNARASVSEILAFLKEKPA